MGYYTIENEPSPKYTATMGKTFGDYFREHLAITGVKITHIASETGVTKESLYSVKYGKTRNMGVEDAIKVASYFGKTVEEFMGIETKADARSRFQQLADQLSPQEYEILSVSIKAIVENRANPASEPTQDTDTTR